jgi:DNA repair exonuclease SbcCD ATPase subunit
MRIRRIKMKHFRSHGNTVITLQRVNFFRGLNRTGKSSVRLAIAMTLAGRCDDVTDEAGHGFELLIAESAQTATVVLEFDDAVITLTLDRTARKTLKVETSGRTILGRQAQDWIAENIAPPDVISACLNATRFLKMSEDDQATLLARVLLPEKLPIEPVVADWLADNKLALVERNSLFATIEATYKVIANARTDVSRTVRDLKNIAEPDPVPTPREEVKAKLHALEEERTSVNNRLLTLTNAEASAKMTIDQIAQIEQQIAEYEQKLAAIPAALIADQRKQLQNVANLATRHAQLKATLSDDRNTLATVQKLIAELDESSESGVCPTCKQPISNEAREKMFEPLMRRQNEANAAIIRIEKQLSSDGDPQQAARELNEDREHHTARLQIIDVRDQLRAKLEQCRKSAKRPDEFAEEIDQLQVDAETLKNRYTKGLDVLVKAVELEERHSEYQKQMKLREAAERRYAELEKLLEYFGPSGIKATLIRERLDMFTTKVNAVLAWWGYSLRFTIEPYALWIMEDESRIALQPNQLSDSERYRLGIAFAHAMAEWTGFGFLIADAAEILDKPDKWQLAQLLLQSDLDQALLFSTGVAGTFEATGTAFFTFSKTQGVSSCATDAETEEELEAAAACQ